MIHKLDANKHTGKADFVDDDFIFNNNEDESMLINPTTYNDDPFMSLKSNYNGKVESRSRVFIKIFTLIFMFMFTGLVVFLIYTSYNPDIITGKDLKSKYDLGPNKIEAKTNNSKSGSQNN